MVSQCLNVAHRYTLLKGRILSTGSAINMRFWQTPRCHRRDINLTANCRSFPPRAFPLRRYSSNEDPYIASTTLNDVQGISIHSYFKCVYIILVVIVLSDDLSFNFTFPWLSSTNYIRLINLGFYVWDDRKKHDRRPSGSLRSSQKNKVIERS